MYISLKTSEIKIIYIIVTVFLLAAVADRGGVPRKRWADDLPTFETG